MADATTTATAPPVDEQERQDSPPVETEPQTDEGVTAEDVLREHGIDPGKAPSAGIEMRTSSGFLTIHPGQSKPTPDQRAAITSLGLDPDDADVIPHLMVFWHLSQARGLDPFAKEVYLIVRGEGRNRKYTLQISIDGYRKIAKRTGRFRRVIGWYWTGKDNDPESWYLDRETFTKHRLWYDMWPDGNGEPGAAKAVIEHYADDGTLTTTSAIAHWGMYAPYIPDTYWENNQKKYRLNEDGSKKLVLSGKWKDGPAHLLAKCAEALAHRQAFPAEMSGLYVAEEMHQADAAEQVRRRDEQAERLREARATARQEQSQPKAPAHETASTDDAGPLPDGDADVVDAEVVPDQDEAREWLLAEARASAEVLGKSLAQYATRWARQYRKNPESENATVDELLALVRGQRSLVVKRLREQHPALAAAVEQADGPLDPQVWSVLQETPGEPEPDGDESETPPEPTDGPGEQATSTPDDVGKGEPETTPEPEQQGTGEAGHPFVDPGDGKDKCWDCGKPRAKH